MTRVVIVGAGHAGGSCAALLRQYGFEGEIALIGEEAIAPYQRPPLSKTYLKRESDAESLKLKADAYYPDNHIALHLGTHVSGIDRDRRRVIFEGGGEIPWDILILATGSVTRRLPVPGADLHGLHQLRSVADAEALEGAIGRGRRLAIVGAGYIGLEVAASSRLLGAEVVVIEREARVLARVASPALSTFFERRHRAEGVEVLTAAGVSAFLGDGHGYVRAVALSDGREVACDAALVGVGAAACEGLAVDAGLECRGGIVVDGQARASAEDIYAIGDCTLRPMPLYGDRMFRLESVPNALEQAKQAAAAITGRPPPPAETPWFWSDQYDVKLQIAGVPFDADRTILRGDPAGDRFAVFHLTGDRVAAVEAVNAPPEFMMGKLLIAQGRAVDPGRLADPAAPIKSVAL